MYWLLHKQLKTKCLNETKNALPSLVASFLTLLQIKKFPEQKKLRKATKKFPKEADPKNLYILTSEHH